MDVKQWVGRNIRAARKAKGLSPFQLAERSGLSADFIGKVERGTTSPSIESLKAIAEALHLSLRGLFEGEIEAGPSQEALRELIRLCRDTRRKTSSCSSGLCNSSSNGCGIAQRNREWTLLSR